MIRTPRRARILSRSPCRARGRSTAGRRAPGGLHGFNHTAAGGMKLLGRPNRRGGREYRRPCLRLSNAGVGRLGRLRGQALNAGISSKRLALGPAGPDGGRLRVNPSRRSAGLVACRMPRLAEGAERPAPAARHPPGDGIPCGARSPAAFRRRQPGQRRSNRAASAFWFQRSGFDAAVDPNRRRACLQAVAANLTPATGLHGRQAPGPGRALLHACRPRPARPRTRAQGGRAARRAPSIARLPPGHPYHPVDHIQVVVGVVR